MGAKLLVVAARLVAATRRLNSGTGVLLPSLDVLVCNLLVEACQGEVADGSEFADRGRGIGLLGGVHTHYSDGRSGDARIV